MKLDRSWNPKKAHKQIHGIGKVVEKLEPISCSCGMTDFVWAPVEVPEPGQMWVWKCPSCHGFISTSPAPRTGPTINVRGDWEPFLHTNMGHEPVLIKSRKHFVEESKARGLRTKWM